MIFIMDTSLLQNNIDAKFKVVLRRIMLEFA